MEETPYAFAAMSAMSFTVAMLVAWGGLRKYVLVCSFPPSYPYIALLKPLDWPRFKRSDSRPMHGAEDKVKGEGHLVCLYR